MKMTSLFGRRGAVAVCIMLSACAAGPSGATDSPDVNSTYGAFLAARYAAAQSDPASASKFYARALQDQGNNQELIAEGFLAGLLAGNPEAVQLAPKLPNNTLATLLLANQAALSGNFDQAKQLFHALPQDNLAGLIKPLLYAWAQLGEGNEQAALTGLGGYFTDPAFGPVYVLNAALIADAAGDTKSAAQLYANVDTSQPNLRLAQILASWQARQGQLAQANTTLNTLISAHPDLQIALPQLQAQISKPVITTAADGMAEAYLTLAGSLNQPQEAFLRTILLRFALQLRPDLAAARLLLANTQTGSDDPSFTPTPVQMRNALTTLQPIQKTDPLYGPATVQEAALLSSLKQPDQAVALMQGLIAANPGNPGLLGATGDILRNADQCPAAMTYYNQALNAVGQPAPTDAWSLFFDRGICEDETSGWASAEPDMLQALKLSPNQPYVLNYVGYSWALNNEKLPEAKAMLQRALSLDPNDGALIDSLGYIELKQGNTKDALALLLKAVQLSADDPEVNGHLGDAFWQNGQPLQAAYQWQRALSLHPDDKLAAELNAKIQQHFGTTP
ncbi:tetratricopeptide repeat protein [Acidocella aromatica]|uniref:Tetratricopeptide (TPR) repeat protein n=1 Tax=Acidocella aromatica TaxID=1303579 RepID=A0A840VU16_9PROT|nr:tetratricopeptide repeat protein [Acidocella aromatica]MBB5373702.1 tetratricopeptide (TPR) repeat protein [Acidocella aromatica]